MCSGVYFSWLTHFMNADHKLLVVNYAIYSLFLNSQRHHHIKLVGFSKKLVEFIREV